MSRPPDFGELVGDELSPEERRRLEHVHDLLVTAGPPPELPPSLAEPAARESVRTFPVRRRAGAALALAAAIALVAFLGGYLTGYLHTGFHGTTKVSMHGTAQAPNALAVIRVGKRDVSGNVPLELEVQGLKPLPRGGYYEMYLTRHHRPVVTCGTFRVNASKVTVRLNAPYRFREFDGWVVTKHLPGGPEHGPTLLTT
jgi:hypothetical protein